jgi:hypothetical protein
MIVGALNGRNDIGGRRFDFAMTIQRPIVGRRAPDAAAQNIILPGRPKTALFYS